MRGHGLRTIAAIAVAVALTAGCGDDGDGTATTGTTGASTTTTAPATTGASSTTTEAPDDEPLLIMLNPDGLGFTTEGSGSVSRIDFGSDPQLTRDAVVRSLGEPAAEGTQEECGNYPHGFARWDEISLSFNEDQFVGWSVNRDSPLTTADGIGLGSTLDELEESVGAAEMVEDSTLGREFTAGAYWGILNETEDVVDLLSAGEICVFR